MPTISRWTAWEGGVDLFARTRDDLELPNVMIHVGGIVQTPKGEAPAGMIFWQPDPDKEPALAAFIAESKKVGRYLQKLWAGTPFAEMPIVRAEIDVDYREKRDRVVCSIFVDAWDFEVRFEDLSAPSLVDRDATAEAPFHQRAIERVPGKVRLLVNGEKVAIEVAKANVRGGRGAIFAPFTILAAPPAPATKAASGEDDGPELVPPTSGELPADEEIHAADD